MDIQLVSQDSTLGHLRPAPSGDCGLLPGCPIPPAAEHRRRAILEPNGYRVDAGDSGPPIAEDNLHRIFEEIGAH